MEGEGALVTAATGALGPVVAKLGALLGGDYKLRRRTRKDVKFIKSKLKSVHSILWAVWEREDLDAESKVLKKKALDLADDMHDAVDDFILTMEPSHRSKNLMVQSKIKASPFQDFRARVDDVSGRCHSKWKWKKSKCAEPISNLFSRRNSKSSPPSKPAPPRAPFVLKDASKIVGLDRRRNELIRYLVGEEPQVKMASVVGMAGVGKTTLAHHVYEDEKIKSKFQCRAFVSVTSTPNMKEVLTSILQQVRVGPLACTEARSEEDIIHVVSNFLQDKRYLVIIDDIWHRGEWESISKSFPQNNLGSRIVMATRIDSVPGDDSDNNKLYKLYIRMNPQWNHGEGKWLYRPYEKDVAAGMKPDMIGEGFDYDHAIVRMCGAVPLALLCMFSAMAMVREQQERLGEHVKACDVQDKIFRQVKENGIQNTPGFEPLVESLQLGYDDLPHHMLKTCLLYCSIYPENYWFYKDYLVMRWVAEGFIYKEDAGEGYLKELGDRGLLIMDSSTGYYIMNPMMRNFLRWKSREDNFSTCSSDITSACSRRIHRLCIDDYPDDDGAVEGVDPLSGLDWSRIRSLVVFKGAKRLPFEKLECVRVLDLQLEKAIGNHHVKVICGLLRVRHLFGLVGKEISEIPPEIAKLQYLETLQVRETSIRELPGEICDLHQLKNLDMSGNRQLVGLPREIGDLQNLETLDVSNNPRITSLPREIGKLRHLKTLQLHCTKITGLPSEIGNLQNLENLNLIDNRGITVLPREIGKLQNLKRLLLSNTGVVKLPREIGGLRKLKILDLHVTVGALPWEAIQLPELVGVPECVRQAWKSSDIVSSELGVEMMSIRLVNWADRDGGLIVGRKHMHIPGWIKDHFNDLGSLDIRICKLEDQDLKILREMPSLRKLMLRFEVVPREPIVISGEGFPRLQDLVVDSRCVPQFTFQEGAMPMLGRLFLEFKFYGGQLANKDPLALGIKHLRHLRWVAFECNEEWYRGAAESSPCMSDMIDVVRKEAQEHPNPITFLVSGRQPEHFDGTRAHTGRNLLGGDPCASVIGFLAH